MNKDKLVAYSYSGVFGEIKTIELTCEKESLLDHNWLFNNIPWSNHDNQNAKVLFDTPIEAYAIYLDGCASDSAKLKKFTFDSVLISAFHGFAGNIYSFSFNLGKDITHANFETYELGFSVDEVKTKFSNKVSTEIKGLKNQINNKEIDISIIMALTLDNE